MAAGPVTTREAGTPGTVPRLRRELIGALPAVNMVLGRLGFDRMMAGCLPVPDVRCAMAAAEVIGALVRCLATGRQPLYALADWAAAYQPGQLGVRPGQARLLNDDRIGRALDLLSEADRASMMTALSLAAAREYQISTRELHNDSTSLALYGAYRPCGAGPDAGQDQAARRAPRPARGFSKDHRPDLRQLVWILTVTADGNVPFTARMADGNTTDDTTHIQTWRECRDIAGHPGFLYVADSKLAAGTNMTWIDDQHGRFVTILPRSRREDTAGRDAIAAGELAFQPTLVLPGRRRSDPPRIWETAPAPALSAEGWPITWARSSAKRETDARAREDRITRATAGLQQLAGRLNAPRCQLRTREAVERAAAKIISDTGAGRWVSYALTSEDRTIRKRNHRSPGSRWTEATRTIWTLTPVTDTALAARDAASDGCFPLITNDSGLTPAQVLAAYKRQPGIEPRHHAWKTLLHGAPARLHTPARIDALAFCLYAALLVHALIEHQLRQATAAAGLPPLRLYHEHRPAPAATGTVILAQLDGIAVTTITHRDQEITIPDNLTSLQKQLITLLRIPAASYGQDHEPRWKHPRKPA
jgi:uncharacterized protein DUF4277